MIKKENDFIQDNLVDISGLVQLGAETAPTPWDKSACGTVEAPGAGMLSTSTSNGQTGSESKKTSDLEEVWLPSNTSGSLGHSGYNLSNFPTTLPVSLPLSPFAPTSQADEATSSQGGASTPQWAIATEENQTYVRAQLS